MKEGPVEALKEIIERVSETIKEGTVLDAYLAGGIATYIHVESKLAGKEPYRYSEDVDIYFARGLSLPDEIVVTYKDHDGEVRALMLDRNYNPELGPRHPDALTDATTLFHSRNGRIQLKILTPVDLAVTKSGRFQDHDREDIELLARCGLLEADAYEARAKVAVDYLATDPKPVLANIQDAVGLIRRSKRIRAR